jgi:Zn-dependent peptidase ImmA (M78 family)/transcriptional regulator with XRE-family HTH domain
MFHGERLRQLREMLGYTQNALCDDVGDITQYQLSRFEKGQSKPDQALIDHLARRLGVSAGFFERESRLDLRAQTPQLRARSRLTARAKNASLEWGRLVVEEHRRLEKSGRSIPSTLPVLAGASPPAAAAKVRRWLGFGASEPMWYLVLGLERLGVTVVGLPLDQMDLDVFSAWQEDRPVIGLLRGVPSDRLRFSVAHELAHLVLHRETRETGRGLEQEADEFAAALLAPAEGLHYDLPSRPTLSSLTMVKTKWGVSIKFLVRRSRELGFIDQERTTSLYRQMSARGWNRSEPGHVPLEKPRAFRKLAEISYGPGDIASRLANDAHWSEGLARLVLAQHATVEELPFEARSTASSVQPNVVPLGWRQPPGSVRQSHG